MVISAKKEVEVLLDEIEKERYHYINFSRREGSMKQLKKDLQSVVKDLKSLTRQTEKIRKKLDSLEKTGATKRPKEKARAKSPKKAVARKPRRQSAADTVLKIVSRSRKGVDTTTLRERTGLKENNLRMIFYRLKKAGKIKTVARGIYAKA
ncbi:MAG: hypothetical protein V3W43_08545 [Desulfatiglandaceae bacterium]